jgi:hypothetical protein
VLTFFDSVFLQRALYELFRLSEKQNNEDKEKAIKVIEEALNSGTLEFLLFDLAELTAVDPRKADAFKALAKFVEKKENRKSDDSGANGTAYWAKGTGYGTFTIYFTVSCWSTKVNPTFTILLVVRTE